MFSQFIPRTLLSTLLMALAPVALADGGAGVTGTVLATYRCQGGLHVQVNQIPNSPSVRVTYGGQTFRLNPVPDSKGTQFQNTNLLWTSGTDTSFMKNARTGKITLSGCVQE